MTHRQKKTFRGKKNNKPHKILNHRKIKLQELWLDVNLYSDDKQKLSITTFIVWAKLAKDIYYIMQLWPRLKTFRCKK